MSAKRFTTEEINFVKEEVSKRGLIINTKECDAVTVVKKKLTWEEIAAAYNKVPSFEKRTTKQLQKLWDNVKMREKNKQRANKNMLNIENGTRFCLPSPHALNSSLLSAFASETPVPDPSDFLEIPTRRDYSLSPSRTIPEVEVEDDTESEDPLSFSPTASFLKTQLLKRQQRKNEIGSKSGLLELQKSRDAELHRKKMEEMDIRLEIARNDLETAQYLSNSAKRKSDLEEEILRRKLSKLDEEKDSVSKCS